MKLRYIPYLDINMNINMNIYIYVCIYILCIYVYTYKNIFIICDMLPLQKTEEYPGGGGLLHG